VHPSILPYLSHTTSVSFPVLYLVMRLIIELPIIQSPESTVTWPLEGEVLF
jgi:hypothetical protein